jgi:hypothetical protein
MYTKAMKFACVAALALTIVFWTSAANYQLERNLLVCVAAGVVLVQAIQIRKYRWAAAFLIIAFLFNPVAPVFRLTGAVGLSLVVLSVAPFAVSFFALRPEPLMSVSSIRRRNPGSQSL